MGSKCQEDKNQKGQGASHLYITRLNGLPFAPHLALIWTAFFFFFFYYAWAGPVPPTPWELFPGLPRVWPSAVFFWAHVATS